MSVAEYPVIAPGGYAVAYKQSVLLLNVRVGHHFAHQPARAACHGVPPSPEALSQHRAMHYFSGQARRADEFRFLRHGETFSVAVSGNAAVNEMGLYIKMCLAGFRLAQLAENIIADRMREGRLVEVLKDWQPPPVPVTLLYPHQRFLSPAVRAFAEWMSEVV